MGYENDYQTIVAVYMSQLDNNDAFDLIDQIISGLSYGTLGQYSHFAQEDGLEAIQWLFEVQRRVLERDDAHFCGL
jgi:hypothetical protein